MDGQYFILWRNNISRYGWTIFHGMENNISRYGEIINFTEKNHLLKANLLCAQLTPSVIPYITFNAIQILIEAPNFARVIFG